MKRIILFLLLIVNLHSLNAQQVIVPRSLELKTAAVVTGPGSTVTIKSITVNHAYVGADMTGYPVTYINTLANLKSVANGGLITDAQGDDIVFTSDNGGATPLKYKLLNWVPTTGYIEAVIAVDVTTATDKVFYLKEGDATITTNQSAGSPYPTAIKAHWHFGDGSTLALTDNANSITLSTASTPTAVAGKVGSGAIDFNTIGRANATTTTLNTSQYTINIWYNWATNGGTVIERGDAGSNVNYYLNYSTGNVRWTFGYNDGTTFRDYFYNVAAPTTSTWYMYTVTVNTSTNLIKFYINGSQVSSQTSTGTPNTSGTQIFNIASDRNLGGHAAGKGDDCWIANIPEDANWISLMYNLGNINSTVLTTQP